MRDFNNTLSWGQAGESLICSWLKKRGNIILPVYEKIIDTGKGPQIFLDKDSIVAPDIFVFRNGNFFWAECKRKMAFSWYRKGGYFTTGIDLRHYEEYLRVMDIIGLEVYLFFLHMGGQAKDSPPSPSGLFFGLLSELRNKEDHRSDKWGRSGMVYWRKETLKKVAELNEL